ncbi:TPA: winged helix-turn-helix domain-containing protein, partial [Staphylococcus aureus]|nr:winged helix-turn-helix domain-containing protein [Staphylococcus aureus]
KCWESENFIDDNTLAVNMTRLRKKLNTIGVNDFIITKKNVGYKV